MNDWRSIKAGIAAVLATTMAISVGCATKPDPPILIQIDPLRPAETDFRNAWIYPSPRTGTESRFVVESGRSEGSIVLLAFVEPLPGDHADFLVRESVADAGEPISEQLVVASTSGVYTTARMRNIDRARITLFDPPMTIMPAQLSQDVPFEEDFAVQVARLNNPERIEQRGTGTSIITYRGVQRIDTPAGTFDAHLIRTEFTTDFGVAKAMRTTDRWYAQDIGLVAESFEERIRVFGVPAETRQRSMRRAAPSSRD